MLHIFLNIWNPAKTNQDIFFGARRASLPSSNDYHEQPLNQQSHRKKKKKHVTGEG